LVDREKLEEAFKLLDSGRENLRSLKAKLGIPKSTLCCWYGLRLEERVEERKKVIAELEQRISELRKELNELENKKNLEGGIEGLKKVFERQGIPLEEGMKMLREVKDLREERNLLEDSIAKLKRETSEWGERAEQACLSALQLESRRKRLEKIVSGLSSAYH